MLKSDCIDKAQLKELSNWVKESSNSRSFIRELKQEVGSDYTLPITEFSKQKLKKIAR